MIYFDNSATTLQKPKEVFETLNKLSQSAGNSGRSAHKPSMLSSQTIYQTRQKICEFFNFDKPENVVFTYNATYALNLAIKGLITEKCTVLTSSYEHNSVIRPLNDLMGKGVVTKIVKGKLYDHKDFIDKFEKSIDNETKFAVINHVSNVFGYKLPIEEIDHICYKNGIKLILDVSQSAGIINIDMRKFKSVCAVCMPAHKSLYGVMGLGVLLLNDDSIKSIIQGGTGSMSSDVFQPDFMPDMLESGTPNIPAIGALYYGIDYLETLNNLEVKIFNLAKYFSKELDKFSDTKVFFNDDILTQAGVVSFINENFDNEVLSSRLAKYDICTRAGYHCSPLAHESAKVCGTIRASFSSFNTIEEVDKFMEIYKKIISE